MVINIRAVGMELTPAIRQYVEEKFQTLEKFAPKALQIDVSVGKESDHHNKGDVFECIANMEVPGDVLRVERNAMNLYKAIDKVKDHLRETLAQKKERDLDDHR
ncbi:MAG: ribosome-associated translation inhibitor RaiA [Patescibacteria group bacterium]